MAIGTSTGERYEDEFDYITSKPDLSIMNAEADVREQIGAPNPGLIPYGGANARAGAIIKDKETEPPATFRERLGPFDTNSDTIEGLINLGPGSENKPITGVQFAMADEDIRGGKVIRPDFGAPSGKTGGSTSGEVVNIKGQFEQKKVYNAIQEIDKGRGPELMKRDPELYRQAVREKQANYAAEVRQKKEDAVYDVIQNPNSYSKGTLQEVQRNFPEEFKNAYARVVRERQAKIDEGIKSGRLTKEGQIKEDPYDEAVFQQTLKRIMKDQAGSKAVETKPGVFEITKEGMWKFGTEMKQRLNDLAVKRHNLYIETGGKRGELIDTMDIVPFKPE
jgi:hypothetical protein